MAKFTFEHASDRLKTSGLGFTEVLPIERVLDAPQAHQPGKLRDIQLRGLNFAVPEFPRVNAADDEIKTLAPPEHGEHTLEILQSAGISPDECAALLASEAVAVARPDKFAWAPVRSSH